MEETIDIVREASVFYFIDQKMRELHHITSFYFFCYIHSFVVTGDEPAG